MNAAVPATPLPPAEVDIKPSPLEDAVPLPVTAAKLVKQVPPQQINLDARLDDVIASLELKDVPFARAVRIVSSLSGLPITLDADAMRWRGVSPRDPISLSAKRYDRGKTA